MNKITFTLNGQRKNALLESPDITVLQYLRANGWVGTKEGCAEGDCGACTVALVGKNEAGKAEYQAVNSCLMPLGALAGQDMVTVEGVAPSADIHDLDSLHPVQQMMVETGGSQCGYCTPGFIMSMFAAYYRGGGGDASDRDVEGNLCRCTGYLPIRKALANLDTPAADDPFVKKLKQPLTSPGSQPQFSPTDTGFIYPATLTEVFEALETQPDAVVIAGATDLGVDMNDGRLSAPTLISLEHVSELKVFEVAEDTVTIGAGVTLSQLESLQLFPALSTMISWFASRQIRNRATIGGNIATASPIGDLPPVLLVYDASITIANKDGTRELPLAEFFKGYRQTDLEPGDIITQICIPRQMTVDSSTRLSQSYKVGKRGTDDISIVAAAFCIDIDEANIITHARLAYGGVAATPARAVDVETWLVGKPWTLATIQTAKAQLSRAFTPLSDVRGSAEYRRMLIANLVEKFFVEMQHTGQAGEVLV
ncbi:MAG: xanthine dehydrogenase small subunit [Deinococcota bacterium]